MKRAGSRMAALAAILVAATCLCLPAAADAAPCSGTHWIGAWEAPPSDASGSPGVALPIDASADVRLPVDDETIRAALTPSYGGSVVRVHLTNRFGLTPAVFGAVTIALQGSGAALGGPAQTVTFGGSSSVTVPAGQDVVSDPVHFSYSAMQTLYVSMYVTNDVADPTEHFTARQTSYLTAPGGGDHSADPSAQSFLQSTTARPYLEGLDVVAPDSAGAVVAFGDSITDGFQGQAPGIPEVTSTVNADGRWPDDLARRLIAAHIPLSVLNAGISGNKVLVGPSGSALDSSGPSALSRLKTDVLDQAGITTVIWLEGINDVAGSDATAAQLEVGLTQGITEMHAAGLRVILGTLTPSGSATGLYSNYSSAAVNTVREQLNTWIRTESPADGVIDFDAVIRDPGDPSEINPAYNGGDGLHMDLAGYQAMADTINLSLLRRASCTHPHTTLRVTSRHRTARHTVVLTLTVTAPVDGHQRPLGGAMITLDGHRRSTNVRGRATITVHLTHSSVFYARVVASGFAPTSRAVRLTIPSGGRSG